MYIHRISYIRSFFETFYIKLGREAIDNNLF